ncbi:MAG: hypothetical protein ACOYXR_01725 [Nitrospirota bacterium]
MTTRTKKVLIGAVITAVVAGAGGMWWLAHSLDAIVASAIRTMGPRITGVSVDLEGVTIAVREGRATLHGLVVGNPEGFKTDQAFSVGEVSLTLALDSLGHDVILIKRIAIEQPEVTYELGPGGSNLDAIQHNVDRYVGGRAGGPKQTTGPDNGTKFVIEDLSIRGAKATVGTSVVRTSTVAVPIPDVHLRDIGKRSGGATAGDVVKQIVGALTRNVTREVAKQSLGGAVESLKGNAGATMDTLKGLLR